MTSTQENRSGKTKTNNNSSKSKAKAQQPATQPDVTGQFAWFELRAKDPQAQLAFLMKVVGFDKGVMSLSPGEDYRLLLGEQGPVGGVVVGEPGFVSYLAVDDVDDALRRVIAAGGRSVGTPHKVPTVGHMAEVKDPTDASFFLYRAEQPAPRAGGDRALHWNELATTNVDSALAFYTSVFGYALESMPMQNRTYHMLTRAKTQVAGVMPAMPGQPGSQWTQYISVKDVDAACGRARDAGGQVVFGPETVSEIGRFAIVLTTEGAALGLITPHAS